MHTTAWRIGRIGGIEIRIDPSWSFIAFLVGYTFFLNLSAAFPTGSGAARVGGAALMALAFFAGVLLHELAHSWMARARGVDVRGITLFLFGGATEADLDRENPNDELAITIVGPLTSLALGGILWGLATVAGEGMLAFGLRLLGQINLALAVFNMVPGFPLDGGRVLRSLVWRSTGDIVRATRTAARSGQIVGYILMGLGIAEVLFLGALISGLWLVAIGWFLSQAAQASFTELRVRRMLAGVPASRIMTPTVVEVPADMTITEAVEEFILRHDVGAFPVRAPEGVLGILTVAGIRRVPREEWPLRHVRDVLVPLSEMCVVGASDPMDEVLGKLESNEAHRVLVLADGDVAGIITAGDLTRWLSRLEDVGLTAK